MPPAHVALVIMENRAESQIIGSASAPYINSLPTGGAYMSNSFGVTHSSDPNYMALFSGSTQGLTTDACPLTFTGNNMGQQLLNAGLTFTGYPETLPSVGYTGCTSGTSGYPRRKHAPWPEKRWLFEPEPSSLSTFLSAPPTAPAFGRHERP